MPRTHPIRIAPDQSPSHLSKGQKAFNTLIKKIQQRRARLADWERTLPTLQQKHARELAPLFEALAELQIKLVHSLDQAYYLKGITKNERSKIEHVIIDLTQYLLTSRDDAALKVLFNRYSRSDYDSEEAASRKQMQAAMEAVLGFDLGCDVDINSPEDILKRIQALKQERAGQDESFRQAQEERQARRKKSAKQLAREAQKQSDLAQVRLSIREVYRKLVSALHPDREPDPEEHKRKTRLMQRVNLAYEKNDLLQLLELQLELEHIDQGALDSLSEDRLKHYNQVLKEQLGELEAGILRAEGEYKAQLGLPPSFDLLPGRLVTMLDNDIALTKVAVNELERDLLELKDVKAIKAWLKKLRQPSRRWMEEEDDPFF